MLTCLGRKTVNHSKTSNNHLHTYSYIIITVVNDNISNFLSTTYSLFRVERTLDNVNSFNRSVLLYAYLYLFRNLI